MSLQPMSFWCLFLDPHATIHHSNIGVSLKCGTELVMSTLESCRSGQFKAHSPMSLQPMSFWCLFLDPHATIHHSNIGVSLKCGTEVVMSTLESCRSGQFKETDGGEGWVSYAALVTQINVQTVQKLFHSH